jgi:hypothetical protein
VEGTALGGPLGGFLGNAIGAGLGQIASNALTGRPLDEGLLFSVGFSALTEGAGTAAGAWLGPKLQNSRLGRALGDLLADESGQAGLRRAANRPGRAVDIDKAAELSGIPRGYLERVRGVAQEKGVDAAFREANHRLLDEEIQRTTVPKPIDVSSPMWKTNEWGYVENRWTGKAVVQRPSGRLIELPPSKVYDPATGRIVLDPGQGRVVGPDVDPYWVHRSRGQIVGETPLDRELRGHFNEAMGGRITHGQWMEYPQAVGPNGPALVVTRRGEFVWLQEREIPAWFDYVGVLYPFSR